MTAVVEFNAIGTDAQAAFDSVELCHRTVFIVAALHHDHRRGNRRKILLDVPVTKRPVEPNVIPSEERPVDVAMMTRQPFAQWTFAIALRNRRDAFQ